MMGLKRRRLRLLVTPLGFAAALAAGAPAVLAQGVLVDKSEIRFVSKQMGVTVDGRFRKWTANIVFLPADLAKSSAAFDIDVASIDLASADSENEIKGAVWFDTAKFPVARFVSSSIKDTGGGKYDVVGTLTMKGIAKPAVVPITMTKDASGNMVADGSFTIKRLDYKLGEGEWADTSTVANEVLVRFRMVLTPSK
jgi:polyisoprenoid-binding protein YceI